MTEDSRYRIIEGDCIKGMKTLPDCCVHTCITSPPYFGLRDYGKEDQIGLEETPDQYVAKMVEVFREVRRVLRDDGTVWLNLGDSYSAGGRGGGQDGSIQQGNKGSVTGAVFSTWKVEGFKNKNLLGIPWRVAFALQADGWYLRQDIIWSKPNPMPESVTDRCTKSHEYIFLLAKSQKYYYDHEAIKEDAKWERWGNQTVVKEQQGTASWIGSKTKEELQAMGKKNKRSVWTVNTKGYKGAHFAVYPKNLILPCILAGCPEGGTVLDPFTGSGTTCVVSLKHGRNFIGTELNPEYIKIATDRITDECPIPLTDLFT